MIRLLPLFLVPIKLGRVFVPDQARSRLSFCWRHTACETKHKNPTMKFPSGATFESSVTSRLKADERLHSLPQNQQSRSDTIVSLLQHASQDCSAAADCSSSRSTAVVRIPQPNLLQLCFFHLDTTSHYQPF
jgi:hypothetical protein